MGAKTMKELSVIEISYLLRMLRDSDAYNSGGYVAGNIVEKLEAEIVSKAVA